MNSLSTLAASGPLGPSVCGRDQGESGDDLGPVSVSGFGRLSWVGVDGGLTGSGHLCAYEVILVWGEMCFLALMAFFVHNVIIANVPTIIT